MVEELIESGSYDEALKQLCDINDEKTRYLRLICLNALGEYKQACAEGSAALLKAQETYYDVVGEYLTSLKECEEYDKAIDLLVEELSMPYIPANYELLYNTAYDEILRLKQEAHQQLEDKSQIFSVEELELLLRRNDINDDLLYMALDQMQQINIRMLLYPIKDYLKDPHKPSFAKTLIMEILIAQEINEELEVEKNGHLYYFNPSISPLVLERECYNGVGRVLQRVLEDNNPSLLNQCLDFLEYYLYDTYPADIYEDEYIQTAGVIHYYVASLQNIEIDEIDLQIHYDMTLEEAERKSLALRIIE